MDAIDKIHIRLKKILEYIAYLENYQGIKIGDLEKDFKKRAIIERYFQLAMEAVLDIANLLNAEFRFRTAEDYRDSILILGEEGVLTKKFAGEFSSIAGFRNILVHDYLKIDYEKVVDKLNNQLGDFAKFAQSVAKYLQ